MTLAAIILAAVAALVLTAVASVALVIVAELIRINRDWDRDNRS